MDGKKADAKKSEKQELHPDAILKYTTKKCKEYIERRCKDVDGLSVKECLTRTFKNEAGEEKPWTNQHIKYNIQSGQLECHYSPPQATPAPSAAAEHPENPHSSRKAKSMSSKTGSNASTCPVERTKAADDDDGPLSKLRVPAARHGQSEGDANRATKNANEVDDCIALLDPTVGLNTSVLTTYQDEKDESSYFCSFQPRTKMKLCCFSLRLQLFAVFAIFCYVFHPTRRSTLD